MRYIENISLEPLWLSGKVIKVIREASRKGYVSSLSESQAVLKMEALTMLGNMLSGALREVGGPIEDLSSTVPSFLKPVTTVALPEIPIFSAKDHFHVGEVEGVRIISGDNFILVFLEGAGKVEGGVPAATLRVHQLPESPGMGPVIAALGGEEVAEITLGQMFCFLKLQGRPHKNVWFTFYIRDDSGILWAVYCTWHINRAAWDVEAYPSTDPDGWDADYQIVSR